MCAWEAETELFRERGVTTCDSREQDVKHVVVLLTNGLHVAAVIVTVAAAGDGGGGGGQWT